MNATLAQATKILSLFHDTPREQLQALLASGLLADLRDADIGEVSREKFRQLVGLEPTTHVVSQLEVFRTIKLGTGLQTADDFRRALEDGGFRIDRWSNDILGKPAFTATTEETEVDLVVVSVAELGFKEGAVRRDIYNRAAEFGLELCLPEVGPQLRLQFKNQPDGEWLFIGMEPIADSDGVLSVFGVARDGGGLWLSSDDGHPDVFWSGHRRWVFIRRK